MRNSTKFSKRALRGKKTKQVNRETRTKRGNRGNRGKRGKRGSNNKSTRKRSKSRSRRVTQRITKQRGGSNNNLNNGQPYDVISIDNILKSQDIQKFIDYYDIDSVKLTDDDLNRIQTDYYDKLTSENQTSMKQLLKKILENSEITVNNTVAIMNKLKVVPNPPQRSLSAPQLREYVYEQPQPVLERASSI